MFLCFRGYKVFLWSTVLYNGRIHVSSQRGLVVLPTVTKVLTVRKRGGAASSFIISAWHELSAISTDTWSGIRAAIQLWRGHTSLSSHQHANYFLHFCKVSLDFTASLFTETSLLLAPYSCLSFWFACLTHHVTLSLFMPCESQVPHIFLWDIDLQVHFNFIISFHKTVVSFTYTSESVRALRSHFLHA